MGRLIVVSGSARRLRSREQFIDAGGASLYVRDIGRGTPIIVLHGGPDFDHGYLLPGLDCLADRFRLVYYDQRGRGRSFSPHQSNDVTIDSEVADLDRIRASFGLDEVAVLGHSWGGLLAMEYAIRHPGRVSHLVLVNTAPASHAGNAAVGRELQRKRTAQDAERLRAMAVDPAYLSGDPVADTEYYRVHFRVAARDSAHLEQLVRRLRAASTSEGVRTARAIEQRLYEETWSQPDYNLLPGLARIAPPTLIIHGDDDFVPLEVPDSIAAAVPGARLVVLQGCGHFCFIEQPHETKRAVQEFLSPSA